MIYRYEQRNMVEFRDGTRASYSKKRYGELLEMVTIQSEQEDRKIWNPYKKDDPENKVILYYWSQKEQQVKEIIIDKNDYEKVKDYYWQLNCNGYPVSHSHGVRTYLYRLILDFNDFSFDIDHIDRNPLNNSKDNLRIVTRSINNRNKTPAEKDKEIPFKGVHYNKLDNGKERYRMRIVDLEGNTIDKFFDSLEAAKLERIYYEQKFGYLRRFND